MQAKFLFLNPFKNLLDKDNLNLDLKNRLLVKNSIAELEKQDFLVAIGHSFSCLPLALAIIQKKITTKKLLWLQPQNVIFNQEIIKKSLKLKDKELILVIRQNLKRLELKPLDYARLIDLLEANFLEFKTMLALNNEALEQNILLSLKNLNINLCLASGDYGFKKELILKQLSFHGLSALGAKTEVLKNCSFFCFEEQGGLPLLHLLSRLILDPAN